MLSENVGKILSIVFAVYTIMLLVGFFALHQILLSMLIATGLLLAGGFAYLAWTYLRGSNGKRGSQSL
jgi:hypothetical protein